MTGIIVADKNEINKFDYELLEKKNINQFDFYIYLINNKKVVVVHSGIGIANSSACAQEMISSFDIKEIFNYGAVGGNSNVNLYDIITPEKIFYHDVNTPWYKRGTTPGENEFFKNSISSSKNNNLASGSSFIHEVSYLEELKKEINADIFDMECASIAQVCFKNNVPLKVIKCVSDIIGSNDDEVKNINERIKKAGQLAFENMLDNLSNN